MTLKERLEWLSEQNLILLFLCNERFWNPLIPAQFEVLSESGILEDELVLSIIQKHLPKFHQTISQGMYFPAPMARVLESGQNFNLELAHSFHYDFIEVDQQQNWSMRGKNISGKILQLFESNLNYEQETGRYFVEYWSDVRWDKCYLQIQSTPMRGLKLESSKQGMLTELNNQEQDLLDLQSIRVDSQERCFLQSEKHGEILLADSPRFWLLEKMDESGNTVTIDSLTYPITFSK